MESSSVSRAARHMSRAYHASVGAKGTAAGSPVRALIIRDGRRLPAALPIEGNRGPRPLVAAGVAVVAHRRAVFARRVGGGPARDLPARARACAFRARVPPERV